MAAVEGFQMSNSMVWGVGYSETEIQTNSPKVNLYYIAALQTTDCAQLVPNGNSPVQTDVSAGAPWSGAKCTKRHCQQPGTQKGQTQSTGVTVKSRQGSGWQWWYEIMKKKTAAVVLLGWVCEVQAAAPVGQDAAKAGSWGSQAAMEGGRTGDTGTTAAVSGSLRKRKVETQQKWAAGQVPVINYYPRL